MYAWSRLALAIVIIWMTLLYSQPGAPTGEVTTAGVPVLAATPPAATPTATPRPGRGSQIYGGTLATNGQFPGIVALLQNGFQFCGGTLIAPQWVLTAAHCFNNTDPSTVTVVAGRTKISDNGSGENLPVSQIISHPGWGGAANIRNGNDLALLRLTNPSTQPVVSAMVNPPQANLAITTGTPVQATVAGWGLTPANVQSDDLLFVGVPITTATACNTEEGVTVDAYLICAGGVAGQDSCQGDSGGPLYVRDTSGTRFYVAGVVSYGPANCGTAGQTGKYTRVSNYYDFIQQQIGYNPANDDIDRAVTVTGPANATTAGASTSSDDPGFTCVATQPQLTNTVWFRFTPSVSASTVVTVTPQVGTLRLATAVLTGTRGNLTSAGCADPGVGLNPVVTFAATAGTTYYVEVASANAATGAFGVQISGAASAFTPTATATATRTPTSTATATATVTGTTGVVPPVVGDLQFLSPPVRVVDTRASSKIGFKPDGSAIDAGPLASGTTTRFKLGGQTFGTTTLPTTTTGVLLNVTIAQGGPTGGFVTVYSGDGPLPTASTVNPGVGINANFWTTALSQGAGTAGSLAVYSVGASRDVVIDVVGYYATEVPRQARVGAATGNLRLVSPVRVLDTRGAAANGTGPIGVNPDGSAVTAAPLVANQTRRFLLAGRTFGAGANAVAFPADVAGVLAHVTTIQGSGSGGFVALVPGDATGTPTTSTVNPGTAIAFNTAAVGIPTAGGAGVAGTFGLYSTNQLDVAVDIVGYYAVSNALGQPGVVGNPSLLPPTRVLDTRATDAASGIATTGFQPNGTAISAGQIPADSVRSYLVAGKSFGANAVSIPADVKGVLLNVTLVQGGPGGGFVTVFPADLATPPNASAVNPSTGIAASGWATGLSTNPALNPGALSVNSVSGPRDLLIDVVGYFR